MRADILIEHAEEIEILWSRRRAVLWSPHETLLTLATLERRLDAHIDGLALDRERAHECFERGLTGSDPDAAFMSAATLLRQRSVSSQERVLHALRTSPPKAVQGVREALAYEALHPFIAERLTDWSLGDEVPLREAAIGVLRSHGNVTPAPPGPALDEVRAICQEPARASVRWVFRLGCLGEPADVAELFTLAAHPALAEAAVRALGSLGCVEAIEPLLDLMREDATAPAAGEAFWRITGIKPAHRDMLPAAEDARFEETRPWPDAEAVRREWRDNVQKFSPAQRRRYGLPLDGKQWLEQPHSGDLLTRREEITRLRSHRPGTLEKLELDAPASRQRLWAH